MSDDKVIPVRVALRSRPLLQKEVLEGCQHCLTFIPNENQVVVGRDKSFTFDYAFSNDVSQEDLYNTAVADRIDYLFKGYNVTVLAYGQTGSGKTYTMGTSYTLTESQSNVGVIQRVVNDIFNGVNNRSESFEFLIKVSFLEVYKEDVYDLLQKNKAAAPITIREDVEGIKVVGLTEQPVSSATDTLQVLEIGSLSRTTASTLMNTRSSRSHAIFTIILEQRSISDATDYTRAKFHLVDLAGSERANKTGALGERFKEGVNINRGLLALGNVISALCEDSSHIPYRDSKLTRLLQDSLGGNSHTVMIACVSPADSNLEETVNTLRYADRARKIKNKPIVNRDPQNAELLRLRQQVQQLQLQLMQSQPNREDSTGKIVADDDYKLLLNRNRQLEEENHRLTKELQRALDQTTALCERSLMNEYNKEKLLQRLDELKCKTNETVDALSGLNANVDVQEQLALLKELQNKIIEIQTDQVKKDHEFTIYSPTKNKNPNTSGPKEDQMSPNTSNAYDTADSNETNIEDSGTYHLESTMKQAALSRELQELERALALKEDLAMRMKESDSEMSVMRMQYEANLKQMEEEITTLQKEKDELFAALKAAHANSNASKVSEQRRKRLKELEEQIAKLKKEMMEKSKMIKIKQDAERKVSVLQQEIQSMRHARVKLLKQMKDEAERYRLWKLQKDREVAQLKQQDRKRQCQIAKMEQQYSKQQNVLKRKMEEAVAANKRLQNALQLQKSVAERRSKEKEQNAATRVKQWVEQELEIQISSKEAEHHLENLLEDRKTISRELNDLKNSLETFEPPKKKRSLGNDDDDCNNPDNRRYSCDEQEREKAKVISQIKLLERDLELRNSQISSLQQRILDVKQNEKSSPIWNNIVTPLEAKCALQWLFKDYSSAKVCFFVENSSLKSKMEHMEVQHQQLLEEKEELQNEISEINLKYEEKLATVARENEEKIIYFLKQLNCFSNASSNESMDADMIQRMVFQEHEISRLGYIHEELQRKDRECQNLREWFTALTIDLKSNENVSTEETDVGVLTRRKAMKLNEKEELIRARSKGNETPKIFPTVAEGSLPPVKKMQISFKKGSDGSKGLSKIAEDFLLEQQNSGDDEYESSFEEFPSYDEGKDPEWRLTPHLKLQRSRHTSVFKGRSSESDVTENNTSGKGTENNTSGKSKDRSTTTCSCSGNCGTKRCSCRKMVIGCTENCKCSPDNCCNRNTESSSQSDSSDSSIVNATYDLSETKGSTNVLKELNGNVSKSLKDSKHERKNVSKSSGNEKSSKSIKHRKTSVFPEVPL